MPDICFKNERGKSDDDSTVDVNCDKEFSKVGDFNPIGGGEVRQITTSDARRDW